MQPPSMLALLFATVSSLAACSPGDAVPPPPSPEAAIADTVEETQPQNVKKHVLETGQPILSLTAIPATAHLGKSQIIAAHGAQGVTIRDTDGTVLQSIDTPARLVAHYQGLLVVYAQDDEGVTTLKRYRLNGANSPELVDTASPSPIAATTLQRTAIASLGPLQISGSDLIIGERIISAPTAITAVASATYFPPLIGGQTLLIATQSGSIIIQSHSFATD